MLAILAAILMQVDAANPDNAPIREPRQFVLYCDEGWRSAVMLSELRREWNQVDGRSDITPEAKSRLDDLNCRRLRILHSVRIVSHTGPRIASQRLAFYPSYTYGDYGSPVRFDDRAFSASGMPLMTLETIIANTKADLTEWKSACESIESTLKWQHVAEASDWLRVTHTQEWESMFQESDEHCDPWPIYSFDGLRSRFSAYDGYPPYTPPTLPPCPLRKFPWER